MNLQKYKNIYNNLKLKKLNLRKQLICIKVGKKHIKIVSLQILIFLNDKK